MGLVALHGHQLLCLTSPDLWHKADYFLACVSSSLTRLNRVEIGRKLAWLLSLNRPGYQGGQLV